MPRARNHGKGRGKGGQRGWEHSLPTPIPNLSRFLHGTQVPFGALLSFYYFKPQNTFLR